jgi:hypothetical protein
MITEELRNEIRQILPELLRQDPEIQDWILRLARGEFAERRETENRFDRLLDELRRDREAQGRKWEEYTQAQDQKWEEYTQAQDQKWQDYIKTQDRKWEEYIQAQDQKWEEHTQAQDQKWEEYIQAQDRKWDGLFEDYSRRWDEQTRKEEERNRKWEERFDRMHEEIMALAARHERGIGALGARWGLQTEAAFRKALAGILEKSFGVEVVNINDYDDEGIVFGRPEQVELDVIIRNGQLIACEIKSSMDKAGIHAFARKVDFYEKKHQRQAQRRIVITPMLDPRAAPVAQRLGIEVYCDADEVRAE